MESPHGKLLGRYEVVAEVGRGAMGAVYKARDPKIDRFVAIKTVLLHQAVIQEQQEFRRRFFVEAQAAGRLLHPGIVAVFDVGEDPETSDPYIVMEFIEGLTLRELLASKGRKLPVHEALRIAQEIAEALDYAHSQGVVHRDIKPANILITRDGQAKISDFGIAQLDLTQMTLPGRVLGTPAYMSPEQLEGKQVDGRSDLFSLGAILYTSLTGHRPFQGNSATTVCYRVANHEPMQPSSLCAELPQELDAVIARALAKNPAERYQRGNEFAEDLRALREKRPVNKPTLWFSPSAAGKLPDGNAPKEGLSARTMKKEAKPLRAMPRRDNTFSALFSSWQVQTAIGIPLFAATLVVSLFAWRELHVQSRASAVPIASLAQGLDAEKLGNAGNGAAPAGANTGDQARTQGAHRVQPGIDEVSLAGQPAPVSKVASPVRSIGSTAPKPPVAVSGRPAKRAVTKTVASAAAESNAASHSGEINKVADRALAAPLAPPVADSNIEVHIENRFADATLKVWIDNNLAYSHPLHDGRKKRLILLGGVTKETLTIPVSAGNHELRIEVRSASEQYDETKSVAGEFLTGGERILSITFDKHSRDMRLALGNQ